MNRRDACTLIAAGTLGLGTSAAASAPPSPPSALSAENEAFLDDMQRRGCRYFVEQAGRESGQVLDRARADNRDGLRDKRTTASIAATGFGLTALCIADHRGYLQPGQAQEQVRRTLRFHARTLPNMHGFYSHFNHVDTGKPENWSEVSSIDTALLLCGVLTARAHFRLDGEIVQLATEIYERVDWPWFQDAAQAPDAIAANNFSMGWNRGSGFLKVRWDHFCELMMLPLLAMGSPTHPVGAEAWISWSRPRTSFKTPFESYRWISGPDPLFVHQYSHAWFDFRGRRDAFADYFANSVTATRAHKVFCVDRGRPYNLDYWGISASDSISGYRAWGGPPAIGGVDGSVVPNATAGSLPFLPADCLRVLKALKTNFGGRAWGRYGFCDALHPAVNWYADDVLGIDLGIGVLMAENLRTGFVWETFARNPEVAVAFQKAGLKRV